MGGVGGAGGRYKRDNKYLIIKQDYKKCSSTGMSTELWTLEDRY